MAYWFIGGIVAVSGADPGIFDRGVPGFSRKSEVEVEILDVGGSSYFAFPGIRRNRVPEKFGDLRL